jgi:hypothetical protein
MKFKFFHGLIWIPIKLVYEGESITINDCILDTGSATTAVDINFVKFNYRKPAFIRRLSGLGGGTQEVICQKIDRFLIDLAELPHIDIEFGDISSDVGINGFIGNDILSQFTVTIDFFTQELNMKLYEEAPDRHSQSCQG